jgi:hypothetical protein
MLFLQHRHLLSQSSSFEPFLDGDQQIVEVRWLLNELKRPSLHGFHRRLELAVRGNDHDRHFAIDFAEAREKGESVRIRQPQIEKHQCRTRVLDETKRRLPGGRSLHRVTRRRQVLAEPGAGELVVIHDCYQLT